MSAYIRREEDVTTEPETKLESIHDDFRWTNYLPWKQWRLTREILCDDTGNEFWSRTSLNSDLFDTGPSIRAMECCPTRVFVFRDSTGAENVAETIVQEFEYQRGTGLFRWLSTFSSPNVRRYLVIKLLKPVHFQEANVSFVNANMVMYGAETHEAAFKRFCESGDLQFIGQEAPIDRDQHIF